ILISDMLEHEPDYSQYGGELSYSRYKASRAYQKFRTNLYGAQVSIYYIQRLSAKPINSADHIRFWAEWIRDNNGRLKQANKLQGGVRGAPRLSPPWTGRVAGAADATGASAVVFLFFVAAGCAYIVLAKLAGIGPFYVTFVPVGTMLAYALLIYSARGLRL